MRILERLQAGDMPPAHETRPDAKSAKDVMDWIRAGLSTPAPKPIDGAIAPRPNEGNRVPHSLLFGSHAGEVVPPPPRLWRLRPG